MSKFSRRVGRSMSNVVIAGVTIVLLGAFGTSLAFAAPASATGASQGSGYKPPRPFVNCDPKDPHLFGGCEVVFKDVSDPNGNQGLDVCFKTTGTNKITGKSANCTPENARGNAFAVFIARQCGPATITATERSKGRTRAASVRINVVCGQHPKG
jgi:hypothetical protein